MYLLLALFRQLFHASRHDVQDRDEAYLAQSVDMADLERRMRQLDRGLQDHVLPLPGGVFSH